MPPPSMNKAANSGFETQRRRHQKSKTGVSVASQKGHVTSQKFLKKERKISADLPVDMKRGEALCKSTDVVIW